MRFTLLTTICAGAAAVLAQQVMFEQLQFPAPEQDFFALSESSFTTFTHPSYPKHSVRVKKSSGWCDVTGATTLTGYIDIEAHHLFFYFFESRNKPDEDPVLMWLNGGPGGSSAMGLFNELGPCAIGSDEEPNHNPWSWSNNASVFFLDQPVKVGFSYADHGQRVRSTEEAAVDIAAFITIFFESFSKFRGRALHFSGESYAGRYLPVFAAEVLDSNSLAVVEGRTPINLKSLIIGNGFSTMLHMAVSSYDMLCTKASVEPLLPISVCTRMKATMPRCVKWYTESCFNVHDEISCGAATEFCIGELFAVQWLTGRDPYDLSTECENQTNGEICYRESESQHVAHYLNRPDVRTMLGADDAAGNFTMSSPKVGLDFNLSGDLARSSRPYIAELLQRDVRVLVYFGSYDWICNWVGGLRSANELDWTGAAGFNAAPMREWMVGAHKAGITKSFGPFSFATVDGASHLVPREKPVESLTMINRWIWEEPL